MIGYTDDYRRPILNIKPLPELPSDDDLPAINLTSGGGPKLKIHRRNKSTLATTNLLQAPNLKDLIEDLEKQHDKMRLS
jgi:hypothetical protein